MQAQRPSPCRRRSACRAGWCWLPRRCCWSGWAFCPGLLMVMVQQMAK